MKKREATPEQSLLLTLMEMIQEKPTERPDWIKKKTVFEAYREGILRGIGLSIVAIAPKEQEMWEKIKEFVKAKEEEEDSYTGCDIFR